MPILQNLCHFDEKVCFSVYFSNFDKNNSITFVITCQSVFTQFSVWKLKFHKKKKRCWNWRLSCRLGHYNLLFILKPTRGAIFGPLWNPLCPSCDLPTELLFWHFWLFDFSKYAVFLSIWLTETDFELISWVCESSVTQMRHILSIKIYQRISQMYFKLKSVVYLKLFFVKNLIFCHHL